MEPRYEISVWNNTNGDHVRKLWEATEADYQALLEQYEDEPFFEVVIDRQWEVRADDES